MVKNIKIVISLCTNVETNYATNYTYKAKRTIIIIHGYTVHIIALSLSPLCNIRGKSIALDIYGLFNKTSQQFKRV